MGNTFNKTDTIFFMLVAFLIIFAKKNKKIKGLKVAMLSNSYGPANLVWWADLIKVIFLFLWPQIDLPFWSNSTPTPRHQESL